VANLNYVLSLVGWGREFSIRIWTSHIAGITNSGRCRVQNQRYTSMAKNAQISWAILKFRVFSFFSFLPNHL